jgi:16S rRNA processing protein RimM
MSRSPDGSRDGRIEIGFVARAHGIRGEVCAITHDPESTTLGDIEAVWIRGQRYAVTGARDTQKGWLLSLDGVPDRTAAEALRGAAVEVERGDIEVGDDEVLVADLVGCAVRLPDGSPWGEIVEIVIGPQLRLLIRHGSVQRELPLVDELVTDIDLDARVVTVDPPEGLPEEPARGDDR